LLFVVLGGLAYILAALDPLGVLLVLAERGGSPALFVVGGLIVIGSALVTLGALAYAVRDLQLDPPARAPLAGDAANRIPAAAPDPPG
jgi:hypothetical protein